MPSNVQRDGLSGGAPATDLDCGTEANAALGQAVRLLANMRGAFEDALVVRWEPLEGSFGLPDREDEYVVVGGAGAIVTDNLKDFPPEFAPSHSQVLSGREFASNTADVDPERAARALIAMSLRRHKTKQTTHELVDLLVKRYGMNDVAEAVLPILDEVAAGDEQLND